LLGFLSRIIDYFIGKVLPGNTLYYAGCVSRLAEPAIEESYKEALRSAGIKFISVPEFNCCGSPVLRAGYKKDFDELKKKNLDIFERYGITRVITNCPGCYNMFRKHYPGLKAEHVTQALNKKINLVRAVHKGKITYHDPCHLGRHAGIYNEPRHILGRLGFEVEELEKNRENALCCGAGGGLKSNYPDIADKAAKQVLSKVKTGLVTTCPLCYMHFKENKLKNMKVFELGQLLAGAVGNERFK